jgi:poly-gamma-glutamate synthesis protein (capsule biosynthesis protein)
VIPKLIRRRVLPHAALAALVAAAPADALPLRDAAAPAVTRLTVEMNGDLLIHGPVWLRASANAGGRGYDFAPMLRPIRRFVRGADLALCHVETPIGAGAPSGYPLFNAPAALAKAIRQTGWDSCDTASNHTLDRGQPGVDATLRALDRHGIRHTGSASSGRGARRITMLRAKGVTVAHLAYTTTTNGLPRPHWWSVNLARPRRIARDARRARRQGAQAVIVNLHWGTEYQHAPDALQLALARRLARIGAITAIVGQHAHVVQPIRRRGGTWVAFGAGNLLSNQTAACCPAASQDGVLVLLHLRVGPGGSRVERVRYVPTWVRHPDYAVLPVGPAYRHGRAPAADLLGSWRRTTGVIGRRPRLRPVPARLAR